MSKITGYVVLVGETGSAALGADKSGQGWPGELWPGPLHEAEVARTREGAAAEAGAFRRRWERSPERGPAPVTRVVKATLTLTIDEE